MKKPVFISILFSMLLTACAEEPPNPEGQNAFTRAVKGPLSGIMKPVPNDNKPRCNSVVDCDKKGANLLTIWQLETPADHSPRDYPANCYVLGDDGKYHYKPATCKSDR